MKKAIEKSPASPAVPVGADNAAPTVSITDTVPLAGPSESLAERAIRLKTEQETLVSQAIEEILTKKAVLDDQLITLGYQAETVKSIISVSNGHKYTKPCRVCIDKGLRIYKGMGLYDHDARSHRAENLVRIAKGAKARR